MAAKKAISDRLAVVSLWALFIVSAPLIADPDFDHHRNVIPGSRAAGLAGAYTALSDDPSGGYYNPAGLAHARDVDISISVNSHQTATLRYKHIASLNDEDFVEQSQTIFPSFVGSSYGFGAFHVGWSYVTLDAKNIDQTDRFPALASDRNSLESYNRSHQEANSHFLAGGSAAVALGDYLAAGLSTYYYRRSIIASNYQLVRATSGSFLSSNQKYTTLNEGLMPVLGIKLKLKSFSFGLSTRQGSRLSDTTTLYSDAVTQAGATSDGAVQISSSDIQLRQNDEANVLMTQLGAAWVPSKIFLLSGDISYADRASDNAHFQGAYQLQPTWNYAVGAELSAKFAFIRAGYFTNNSQFATPREGGINQPAKIDYSGFAVSLGILGDDFAGDLTLIDQAGLGYAQKLSDDPDIQRVEGRMRTVQIGTRYGF